MRRNKTPSQKSEDTEGIGSGLDAGAGAPRGELRKLSLDRIHARARALGPPYRKRASRDKLLEVSDEEPPKKNAR